MIFTLEFLLSNDKYPKFETFNGTAINKIYNDIDSNEYKKFVINCNSWKDLFTLGEPKFYEEKASWEFKQDLKNLLK